MTTADKAIFSPTERLEILVLATKGDITCHEKAISRCRVKYPTDVKPLENKLAILRSQYTRLKTFTF